MTRAMQILARLITRPNGFRHLQSHSRLVDDKGRYLTWDALRRREPPEGLSSEEWWAATRMARQAASIRLDLRSTGGAAFSFAEPPPLKSLLHEIDQQASGTLMTQAQPLAARDAEHHLVRSLAEEPFASSLIEGAATTRTIAKQMIFEGRQPRTRDELMVLNNFRGLEFAKSLRDEELTVDRLLELHRIITDQTLDDPADAGRLRARDDVRVVDDTTGEVLHQPPPFRDLPRRLEALCRFANASNTPTAFLHPIVRACILHFMLGYEHPFVDGNGRTARALFYWYALKHGYWLIEYVSISSVIAEARIAYGKAFLDTEIDDGDVTYFVLHQAGVLREAIHRLQAYADRRRREVAALEKAIAARRGSEGFNARQSALLNDLVRNRIAAIELAAHQARWRVSYLTARSDLERLVARKLLTKRKRGRISVYAPARDLASRLALTG
jgi:Fic family protein